MFARWLKISEWNARRQKCSLVKKTVKIEKEGETTVSSVITINENISHLWIFSSIIEFTKGEKKLDFKYEFL